MYDEKTLHLDSVIESADKYNGKKVSELVEKKGVIFHMIKKGYYFDDEVLAKSNITHNIREHKVYWVVVDHEKDTKKYKKDTATLKEIIKEIDTLEYDGYEEKLEDNNEIAEESEYVEQ